MATWNISCPTCGAPHEVTNPGVRMYLCQYCSNAVYWDTEKVHSGGEQTVLEEGYTRLYRGAAGHFHQKRFCVRGRVRYDFGAGFWDEWYLEMIDGAMCWLTEDSYQLAVQSIITQEGVGPFSHYPTGASLQVRNHRFVVHEAGTATCVGMEGELPRTITTGTGFPYVDASSPDGCYTLGLEYHGDSPSVFLGKWLKYSELRLEDEGVDW